MTIEREREIERWPETTTATGDVRRQRRISIGSAKRTMVAEIEAMLKRPPHFWSSRKKTSGNPPELGGDWHADDWSVFLIPLDTDTGETDPTKENHRRTRIRSNETNPDTRCIGIGCFFYAFAHARELCIANM